jgi:hypothetical protein
VSVDLRGYQRRAADRLVAREAHGLWMAAGLGKTATALAAVDELGLDPVLVVTRAIGRHAWTRDAVKVLGWKAEWVSELWAGSARSKSGRHRDGSFSSLAAALEKARVVVTNYEVLGARFHELRAIQWQALILDEAHEIKGGFAPPKRLESGGRKWRRYEYAKSLARKVQSTGGVVWELTATPVRDRVRDLWAQLHVVLPRETLPFYPPWESDERSWADNSWAGRYCALKRGDFGLVHTGRAYEDELAAYVSSRFVIETRATVAGELPALTRDVRVVTPDWSRVTTQGGTVEDAIARAAAIKAPVACELALEYLASDCRVVLVTSRRVLAHQLAEELRQKASRELGADKRDRLRVDCVTGEIAVEPRLAVCRAYNEGPGCAALVATIDSITTSMDLHYTDGMIFAALPYTPSGIEQTEGRVGRLGGAPCTIHYLVAEETIDDRIRELVLDKLEGVRLIGVDTQGAGGAETSLRQLRPDEDVLAELRQWLAAKEG